MTYKNFLTTLLTIPNLNPELISEANERLQKLEKNNFKRKETNNPLKNSIETYINKTNSLLLCSEIANEFSISVQKANSLLRQLVLENRIDYEEVKVPNKGKQKAYKTIV